MNLIKAKDSTAQLAEIYRKALVLSGQKNVDTEYINEVEMPSLRLILETQFKWITLRELHKVVEVGATGGYGQFYGISPKTFAEWIRAYEKTEDRKNFVDALRKRREPKKIASSTKLTTQEMQEAWEQGLLNVRSGYGLVYLYKLGRSLGHLKLTDEVKKEARERAHNSLKKRILEAKAEGIAGKGKVNELRKVLENKDCQVWQSECERQVVLMYSENQNQ